MNKRHLSAFRRSSLLRVLCILILAVMCAPCAMAAAVTPAPTLATVGGFNPILVAGGIGLAGLGLMNAAKDDGSENGGGEPSAEDKPLDPAAAIKAIEDKTLPMSQRLGVALNALKGIAPAEQFAKVKTDLEAAQAALKTRDGELAAANKQLEALQADVKQLEEANAKLEKENKDLVAKEQDLNKRASDQAKQIVRGVGIEASKLPAAQAGDEAPSVDALRSKLADTSLSSEERGEIVKQIRQIQSQK